MKPLNLSYILLGVLLAGMALTGCSPVVAPAAAQAMATPYIRATAAPAATRTPLPPTPTAVVFELKPTSTPLPTATSIPEEFIHQVYGPSGFPAGVNPLTGLHAEDPALLNRRPMAIKVTNFPRSVRPQWGLSLADHVYEYYLEDGLTRFVGIFYGNDASRVGPVRSGRFFDEHIMRMYKASLTFASADPRVLEPWLESDLKNFLIIERPGNCPPLCRIGPETNYNTLYADTHLLEEYFTERSGGNNGPQNLDGLVFDRVVPTSLQEGKSVSLRYSRVSYNFWLYDPLSGRYLRYSDTEDDGTDVQPLADSLTGKQIAADNLVMLAVPHDYYINTATTEMVEMDFLGEGDAWAFRDGRAYPLRWRRPTPDALISLVYPHGMHFPLKPGTVWFQVTGATSGVESWDQGDWLFTFAIP